jgi:ABC-type branched-subunit amino acid transport system ATPase component
MERMRELVQQSTSGSTELAASAEQMSKMSRGLLDFMDRFTLDESASALHPALEDKTHNARRAAAGSRY